MAVVPAPLPAEFTGRDLLDCCACKLWFQSCLSFSVQAVWTLPQSGSRYPVLCPQRGQLGLL